MQTFSYFSDRQESNFSQIVKAALDMPSALVDFADGLVSSSSTIGGASAVALDSTGATITSNVVGTITVSGTTVRLDFKTGGSGGSGSAANGDRYRTRLTATVTNCGPLVYDIFTVVDADGYSPA